jgi:hypothetical protein
MPRPDSITLHVYDINKIVEALAQARYMGNVIKIVTEGDTILIRDKNDFKISSIKTHLSNEKANANFDQ